MSEPLVIVGNGMAAPHLVRKSSPDGALGRGGDMPEVNNIPPSLSYRPADPAEPVLDISIGDALRTATSTWRTRTAVIDGTSEEQTRRRWTFEELLTNPRHKSA
jgi:hypothetical protein